MTAGPSRSLRALLCASALLPAFGCTRELDPASDAGALRLNLERATRLLLVVPDERLRPPAEATVARWRADGWPAELVDVGDGWGVHAPRVVVGAASTPGMSELLGALGVEAVEGGFRWGEKSFVLGQDSIVATFADPAAPALPVTLLLSEQPSELAAWLARLAPAWRPRALVVSGGYPVLDAALNLAGRPVAGGAVRALPRWVEQRSLYELGRPLADGPLALWHERIPRERVEGYLGSLIAVRERVAAIAGGTPQWPARVVLEPDLDGFAPAGEPAQRLGREYPARRLVVALLARGLADDGGQAVARCMLREALGAPGREWLLDAAAVDAADSWWGRPLESWCAVLSYSEARPALDALVDDAAGLSPHLVAPLRALLFRWLRTEVLTGAGAFDAFWRDGHSDALAAAGPGFERELLRVQDAWGESVLGTRADRLARSLEGSGLRGAGMMYPPGSELSGYGTRDCELSLEALRKLGAQAVSVTSLCAADPGPGDGRALAQPTSIGALEGDVALAATLALAHERGLYTMLRPHLLATPSGTWLGSLKRTTAERWSRFFDDYERFLVHYALLAELTGCDLLSLGSGLGEATRTLWTEDAPENERARAYREVKSDGWARLARRARQVFPGALTYAAAGFQEARWIGFWDRLDFVGLDLLPYLGDPAGNAPGEDRMMRNRIANVLERAHELADGAGRPLMVTEIGFRSTDLAWQGEHGGGGATNQELQRRLLRALHVVCSGVDESRGPLTLFLWKWSTDPESEAARDRGYTLRGKEAEPDVGRFFTRG